MPPQRESSGRDTERLGSTAALPVVERFILTMKCVLGRLPLIPYRRKVFRQELDAIAGWYNGFRPHTWLGGRTPDEAYYGHFPANRRPRFEPRSHWPRGSPCARPWALVTRQSRRKADAQSQLLRRAKAPADRHDSTRGIMGSHLAALALPMLRQCDPSRFRLPNCQGTMPWSCPMGRVSHGFRHYCGRFSVHACSLKSPWTSTPTPHLAAIFRGLLI